jgi:hypothetical protein
MLKQKKSLCILLELYQFLFTVFKDLKLFKFEMVSFNDLLTCCRFNIVLFE